MWFPSVAWLTKTASMVDALPAHMHLRVYGEESEREIRTRNVKVTLDLGH